MAEIKALLKEFISTHVEIREAAKKIKLLRDRFKEIKESIGVFMKEKKLDVLDIGEFDICYKNQKYSHSLSKDFLVKTAADFMKNNKLSDDEKIGVKFVEFLWGKKKEEGKEKDRISVRKHRKRKRNDGGEQKKKVGVKDVTAVRPV